MIKRILQIGINSEQKKLKKIGLEFRQKIKCQIRSIFFAFHFLKKDYMIKQNQYLYRGPKKCSRVTFRCLGGRIRFSFGFHSIFVKKKELRLVPFQFYYIFSCWISEHSKLHIRILLQFSFGTSSCREGLVDHKLPKKLQTLVQS